MSIVSVEKDEERLRLVVVAEFAAPIERVWQLWADPRQLERWWGPPTHPSTVQMQLGEHDGGTRMVLRSVFDSREHMEQVVNMGAPEALQQAVGQMDALLAG